MADAPTPEHEKSFKDRLKAKAAEQAAQKKPGELDAKQLEQAKDLARGTQGKQADMGKGEAAKVAKLEQKTPKTPDRDDR